MDNGWETSAQAWIESQRERGDWGREHVLDPVMLERIGRGRFGNALDVGCGEGRFCRVLKAAGVSSDRHRADDGLARHREAARSVR
ncbi:hypothetical protein [Bradyrhizobium sp. CCBAU 51753]|uniref:hypothetical protein n=1 Tax=Bradyrhizobium sp. CCBAU 51753 TaxID=1325100 RepID=UPI001FEDF5E4|nr:hypothetical protein [Bradyrhizobium sp. CCBAU 51753]